MSEETNRPQRYMLGDTGLEVIDLAHGLATRLIVATGPVHRCAQVSYNAGNALKYIMRLGLKEGSSILKDLEKARWYIDDAIAALGGESWNPKPRAARQRVVGDDD